MSDLNKVFVVPVKLEKHPNADSLSVVLVDGYTVVVRTDDWINKDRGAYIPPDNVVDVTRPEFKWLDSGIVGRTQERIKARRFRGVMSQGLLVPIPVSVTDQNAESGLKVYKFEIGDDVTEYFGVTRYQSPEDLKLEGGDQVSGPQHPGIKYDVESWFKYKRLLPEGTEVVFTEKLHGTNARFTFQDGEMYVGSRSFYRKYSPDNLYWRSLKENPWIQEFCERNPNVVLYGEIFGWVQSLKYGTKPGQIYFKAFDVWDNGNFWPWDKFKMEVGYVECNVRLVPIIYCGSISDELVEKHMNGRSTLYDGHMREGIVIKPIHEMADMRLGRVILKAVSPEYFLLE